MEIYNEKSPETLREKNNDMLKFWHKQDYLHLNSSKV